ncbi:AcrR family transcriptional regulator [Actinoplanes lutulentus]|uniref:TetR family transcriptional regulator n=1 Tax=Actinoplanes lutulentus TaxID=1287878 RepID=A0A327YWG8_9ACTN|nr:AcrR family transcriptional regulator [Actinoplanes lutulentus]RAK25715.1 TetR family transcriptional regulator [Actinoplanes lutulentus]
MTARQDELLEAAYRYALDNGLADLSLRPLSAAIGSSPRVLLFLFGSKDGLVRALLTRARADELKLLDNTGHALDLPDAVERIWAWLAAPEHRPLLRLWAEAYTRSLVEPDGAWAGFARATVDDWLDVLTTCQPPAERETADGIASRTLALSVLRGALLDLLATGDEPRTTAAIRQHLRSAPHSVASAGTARPPAHSRPGSPSALSAASAEPGPTAPRPAD